MEQTLALIKPDGIKRGLAEECIKRFKEAGLSILQQKEVKFNKTKAEEFRKELKEKYPHLWESLIEYMTEGKMLAIILEGEEAVEKTRAICGPTNPKDAPKGTIRGDFGEGDMKELYKQGKVIKNIIHVSGNAAEAAHEIKLIFEHDAMKQPERDTRGGGR